MALAGSRSVPLDLVCSLGVAVHTRVERAVATDKGRLDQVGRVGTNSSRDLGAQEAARGSERRCAHCVLATTFSSARP